MGAVCFHDGRRVSGQQMTVPQSRRRKRIIDALAAVAPRNASREERRGASLIINTLASSVFRVGSVNLLLGRSREEKGAMGGCRAPVCRAKRPRSDYSLHHRQTLVNLHLS